ncbi:hypothetical protein ISN45_Aa07g031820 [Arabidopsis thaliana x Arabidopsis arenosa]|uniref:DUF4283 domain-containing protein n=1 Tax=Arabidopsis thaliana x Arabidopsis arenosa TaxID=1240361 RepID=A0A8T1YC07_9BRAS|nr:hypothetical protein ISN45_Aa07g031820 [Arabidopsis thaliana x Arabidopsis arenosa]
MSITEFQPDFVVENEVAKVTIPEVVVGASFLNKTTVPFRIESDRIHEHVLKRRYWHIGNIPLVIDEWNLATAQAPPDLPAMPLWVDLKDVPPHLFSNQGLSFLSSTTGNFVKLHPNTERCFRLDVAQVLVEVNLQTSLVDKICFPHDSGKTVTVLKVFILSAGDAKDDQRRVGQAIAVGIDRNTVEKMAKDLIHDLENSQALPLVGVSNSAPTEGSEEEPDQTKAALDDSMIVSKDESKNQWTIVSWKSPHSSPSRMGKPETQGIVDTSSNGFSILSNIGEEENQAADPDSTIIPSIQEEGEVVDYDSEDEDAPPKLVDVNEKATKEEVNQQKITVLDLVNTGVVHEDRQNQW